MRAVRRQPRARPAPATAAARARSGRPSGRNAGGADKMATKFRIPEWVESIVFGDGCGKPHKPDKNGEVSCDECAAVAQNHTFHSPEGSDATAPVNVVEPVRPVTADAVRAVDGVMDAPQTTVEELEAAQALQLVPEPKVQAAPAVRARADELGVNLALVKGSGKSGGITIADVE